MEKIKENVKKFAPDSIVVTAGVNNPFTSVGFGYDLFENDASFYVRRDYKNFGFSEEFGKDGVAAQCYTIGLPKSFKSINDLFINETTFLNKYLKFVPVSGSITGCTNNTETNICVNADYDIKYLFEMGLSACWTFNNKNFKEFLDKHMTLKDLSLNNNETLYDVVNKNTSSQPDLIENGEINTQMSHDNIPDSDYKEKTNSESSKIDNKKPSNSEHSKQRAEKETVKSDENSYQNDNQYQTNQAYQHVNVEINSNSNPFFTEHAITAKLYDSSNQLVASETQKLYELSNHSKNGIYAVRNYLTSALINNVFSSSINRTPMGEIAKIALLTGGEAFARSYIDEQVLSHLNSPLSKSLAGGLVDVGFAIVHGNAQNAVRVGFESTANRVMQQFTQLPLSYSTSRFVSTNDLFGGNVNVLSVDSTRYNLNMALGKGASIGVHFEEALTQYKNSNGFIVHQYAHGLGAHFSYLSVFDASVGLMSGYEVSEPLIQIRGNTQIVTTFERSFEGQLRVAISLGDKRSVFDILPPFSSETKETTSISNVDGTPLRIYEGLPLRYLNQNQVINPNFTANTNIQNNGQSVNIDDINNNQQQKVNDADLSFKSEHMKIANKLFEPYMQQKNGRTESIDKTDTEKTHKDKYWGLMDDTSSRKIFNYGTAKETFVEDMKTQVVGDELQSSLSFHEAESKFIDLLYEKHVKYKLIGKDKITEKTYKEGEKRTENLTNINDIDLTLHSKADGSAFENDVDLGEKEIDLADGSKIKGLAKANLYFKYDVDIINKDLKQNISTSLHETNGIGSFILTENKLNEQSQMNVRPIDNTNTLDNNENNTVVVNFEHTYDVHAIGTVECNLVESSSTYNTKKNVELEKTETNREFNGQNDTLKLNTGQLIHETNKIYTVDQSTATEDKPSFLIHRNVQDGSAGKSIDDYVHKIKDTHLRFETIVEEDAVSNINPSEATTTTTNIRTAYGIRVEHEVVSEKKGIQPNSLFTFSSQETQTQLSNFTETSDIKQEDINFLNAQLDNTQLSVDQTPFRTINTKQEVNDGWFVEEHVKTVSDTGIENGAPRVQKKIVLNTATQRAGSTLVGGATNLILKRANGKELKASDYGKLAVSTAESFAIGHASKLAQVTKGAGLQLGIVGAVAAGAAVCSTVKALMDKDDNRSAKEKLAMGAMDMAPAISQVACAAKNLAKANIICSAVSVAAESAHCAVEVYKGKKTMQDLGETVATSVLATAAGTATSLGVTSALTAVGLGAVATWGIALTSTGLVALAASAGMIVIPAVCCSVAVFAVTKVASYFIQKIKYKILCKKLGIEKDITDEGLRSAFRKAALKAHPDKGGSANDFEKLVNDYKKLSELRNILKISEFQKKEKENKTKRTKLTWNAWFYSFLDTVSKPFEANCDEKKQKAPEEKKYISYDQMEGLIDGFKPDGEKFTEWKETNSKKNQ